LPDVLFVIVVLGDDGNTIGDQVGRVETNSKLTDHRNVSTRLKELHERLGSRLGNCTEVVDKIGLGHTDSSVSNGEGLGNLVRDDFDFKLWLGLEKGFIGQGLVTNLVEGIRGVRDEFSKEDILVRVESVNDK